MVQHLVLADHVPEQLLPVLAFEHLAPRTLHRLVLPQLRDHLVPEVLHGQVVHPLSGLVLGLWFKSTQLTHPRVGDEVCHSRLLPDGF